MIEQFSHTPVMLKEVVDVLCPAQGEIFVDCTLGGAGHSFEVAKKIGNRGLLIGIDQDLTARKFAKEKLDSIPFALRPEIRIVDANFSELDAVLMNVPVPYIDCVLFDLGVSSVQLDVAKRGFSYRAPSPLDMRMNQNANTLTASDIVNTYAESEIERILRVYGEEKFSKKIAKNICERRASSKITTSDVLVDIIKDSIPARYRRSGGHPAKRTFQALRIAVNNELENLEIALDSAIKWTRVGGRICVISYHSLEDRIVKQVFKSYEQRCTCPQDVPVCVCNKKPILKNIKRGVLTPSEEEVEKNPRSRSAKLRCVMKISE